MRQKSELEQMASSGIEGAQEEAPATTTTRVFGSAVAAPTPVPVNEHTDREMRTEYEHVDFTGVDFDTIDAEEVIPQDHPDLIITKVERGSPQYTTLIQRGYREYNDPKLLALIGDEFQLMALPRKIYEKRYQDYLARNLAESQVETDKPTDIGRHQQTVKRNRARFGDLAGRLPKTDPTFSPEGVEA